MTNNDDEIDAAMRELAGFELSEVESGDGWAYGCVAGSESYGCVTTVGGKVHTSSGPVPH
jgi:hypothetical protein